MTSVSSVGFSDTKHSEFARKNVAECMKTQGKRGCSVGKRRYSQQPGAARRSRAALQMRLISFFYPINNKAENYGPCNGYERSNDWRPIRSREQSSGRNSAGSFAKAAAVFCGLSDGQ